MLKTGRKHEVTKVMQLVLQVQLLQLVGQEVGEDLAGYLKTRFLKTWVIMVAKL
jgi:hypothetical protein